MVGCSGVRRGRVSADARRKAQSARYDSREPLLRRFLDEVPGRDADQKQQRPDDRRCADNLNRLALRLDAADGIEDRSRADEIDTLDSTHVDRYRMPPFAEHRELGELRVRG